MYTLFDPPVNEFSPPENISAWLHELRALASRPEFRDDPQNRQCLEDALAEAESMLVFSRSRVERVRRNPPNR
ncbi:MAG TPA: hypothetical protein VF771_02200, partial [Longimicrobiaceae bacterium]